MPRYEGRTAIVRKVANLVLRVHHGHRAPTPKRLAAEWGVCERTARRYLAALDECGWLPAQNSQVSR